MYKILFDWRSEGFKFEDNEFQTVSAAVEHAVKLNYSVPFLIVQIIQWEAIRID